MLASITIDVDISGPDIAGDDEAGWSALISAIESAIDPLTFTVAGREYVINGIDAEVTDWSED